MVMEGDWTRGGEHTTRCADDVLWNCAPGTCMILLTRVTPINPIKRKKRKWEDGNEINPHYELAPGGGLGHKARAR